MKEGYIENTSGVPTEEELSAINKLSRRNLSTDEVFVFSVVLCDNEIDRDFERFSDKALETMAKLYVGKTGIFDHSMKGRDQVARIFHCSVEKPKGQTTTYGAPYVRVKARAYMPKTEKNKDMITEIDAGIKKEVSVGCSVERVVCSVCGANQKNERCEHKKGRVYHRKGRDLICHHVLDDPADAYEWSFVAVPAQRGAGVVKAFSQNPKGGMITESLDVLKTLSAGEEVTLSPRETMELASFVENLQKSARAGREHFDRTLKETVRLAGLTQPDLDRQLFFKMLGCLEYHELFEVNKAFQKQLDSMMPPVSQFEQPEDKETKPEIRFDDFMI